MGDQSPHARMLSRDLAGVAKVEHKVLLELLDEVADYGADLIVRCYTASDKQIEDLVLLPTLLKQVVAMLDGVRILTAEAAGFSAPLQIRGMVEASLYIDWILKKDTRRRACTYLVSVLRRRRAQNVRTQDGTVDYREMPAQELAGLRARAAAEEAAQTRLLAGPELAPINAEFERLRGNKPHDPHWYIVAGARSVAAIARDVGRFDYDYEWIYAATSNVMHGVNLADHVLFGPGEQDFAMLPIRDARGGPIPPHMLFGAALNAATETYKSVLLHYRRHEEPNFARKYVEEWRDRLPDLSRRPGQPS